MPRPCKKRRIGKIPENTYFKPAGIPKNDLKEVNLTMEEVEAIRLKDKKGLFQEECAEKMGISRSTFQRILLSAREKIADALINGKAMRFQGGNYRLKKRYYCSKCNKKVHLSSEKCCKKRKKANHVCPECGSKLVEE